MLHKIGKKILAVLMTLIMTISLLPAVTIPAKAFSGSGSGTTGNPYRVQTAAELDEVRNDLTACYIQTADIDISSYSNWVPIGTYDSGAQEYSFSGTYDGNGYKVTGLNIVSSSNYVGLFGAVGSNEAAETVLNLGVSGTVSGGECCGLLAGRSDGGVIKNCYSLGAVTTVSYNAGGLIGYSSGTITNSFSAANVTATGASSSFIGGFVGFAAGNISGCHATGEVKNEGTNASIITGGFVGRVTAKVSDSYSTGNVKGSDANSGIGKGFGGGFIGQNNGTIEYCFSVGKVSSQKAGGFVGNNAAGSYTDCYYDSLKAGTVNSYGGVSVPSGGITGAATNVMMLSSTFSSYNTTTTTIWHLADGVYPIFQWQIPGITSISPGSGGTKGGTSVTITGANFNSSATVTFGGIPATSVKFSSGSLTAVTPAHITGSTEVIVTLASITSAPGVFSYEASSDAGLASVAGQTAAPGSGNGLTSVAPITWSISVPYATGTLGPADIAAVYGATKNLYTNADFSGEITGAGTISLTQGGATTVYIKITAEDTTTVLYYAVTVNRAPAVPDMRVEGNNTEIAGGDMTPTTGDHTDFGATGVAGGTVARTFTISSTGTAALLLNDVQMSGTNAADFLVTTGPAATVNPSGSTSLTITFNPSAAGVHTATVSISNNVSGKSPYTFALCGTGLQSEAGLTSVAGQTATPGGGNGLAASAPITWSISVPYATGTLGLTDIATVASSTKSLYANADFSGEITGAGSISLTQGGATTVYIKITAEDTTTVLYCAVTVNRVLSTPDDNPPASVSQVTPINSGSTAMIDVNGKRFSAGDLTTGVNTSGQTVTTVTVDTNKLRGILGEQGQNAVVMIHVTPPESGAVVGILTGEMVDIMEKNGATLVLKTETASYSLPASEIDINAILKQFDAATTLSDITVTVNVSVLSGSESETADLVIKRGGYSLISPAVEFAVTAAYGVKTITIDSFDKFIERTILLPDGIDRNNVTTAVIIEAGEDPYSVPTEIIKENGHSYAVIHSLTNSVYAVISNPVSYDDMDCHWARDAVNDLGSRLVISGTGGNMFDPEKGVTRAEFAAILIRALGLKAGIVGDSFKDVMPKDWYYGYIESAAAYGLINGYDDGTFRPTVRVTREQAMVMLTRAMALTKLNTALSDSALKALISKYNDASAISGYAVTDVALCLASGLINGKDSSTLAPSEEMTRAEAAVIVQRLLKNSGLI